MNKKLLYSLLFCFFTSVIFAQNVWIKTAITTEQKTILAERNIPLKGQLFSLNMDSFKGQLNAAPQRRASSRESNTIIEIPNAKGNLIKYKVVEASVFAADLQAKYPEIRAYAGYAVDDASTYVRFTISPYNGMNGIVLTGNRSESEIIEVVPGDVSKSIIFKRSDRKNSKELFECSTKDESHITIDGAIENRIQAADDSVLRTFDLAMSVTGEYSAFHGGTLASVNAAIATTVARQNSIFEIDFAITLVLIASNDNVVFLDANTDPYGNTDANYNSELQTALDQAAPIGVGSAAYDVGHLMSAIGNNGNAGCIGCICVAGQKGSGYTTSTSPIGDTFDIDFVAHELGHQFGGRHTFTHSSERDVTPPIDNTGEIAQMEPGSGSTIMGYAGITGATDVQSNSDPYFHAISIQQITAHAKSRTCDDETAIGNNIPVVNAGANITLPIGTPFRLTGSATDADAADVLTYCWEQYNEDNALNAYPDETSTSNDKPLFRSYNPTISTDRTFPKMEDLLANGVNGNVWEKVPTVGRTADFRLTVRDNRAGGAGNSFADMQVTWDATRGPLMVTSQGSNGIIWSGGTTEDIIWSVNSTDLMTGAATVDILLSTDGGLTYPTTLASGVANDGNETITVPSIPAPYCRIMVQPTGAPFFSINTVDFAIDYLIAEVCTTYNSGTINLGIPDGTGANVQGPVVGHTINIPDNVLISDVNVYFDVTHTYTQDLILLINNVGNQDQVQVVARICGGESGIDATFDDQAGALVCGGTGNITTGVYQASNLLGVFNGQMSGGDWDMLAVDFYNGDTGQVNSYSIEICETVATALAVGDNSFVEFNVYPNPTNGMVNITLSTFDDVKVTLYDISGRQIYSQTLENNSNTFNKNIDLSSVASGVYLLNVKSGTKTATKKLVIR